MKAEMEVFQQISNRNSHLSDLQHAGMPMLSPLKHVIRIGTYNLSQVQSRRSASITSVNKSTTRRRHRPQKVFNFALPNSRSSVAMLRWLMSSDSTFNRDVECLNYKCCSCPQNLAYFLPHVSLLIDFFTNFFISFNMLISNK